MTDIIKSLIEEFYPYAKKTLGFEKPCTVKFIKDEVNYENPLGKTAHYDPTSFTITLYTLGRHPKDIMRSFSHELVHHAQNCRGEFDKPMEAGEGVHDGLGYAQRDPHMREMERQAYEEGNLCFRDWEDQRKIAMQNENTIGALKMNKQQLIEKLTVAIKEGLDNTETETEETEVNEETDNEEESVEEQTKSDSPDRVAGRDSGGRRTDALEEAEDTEETVDEEKAKPDGDGDGVPPWADKDDNDPKVSEAADTTEEEVTEDTDSDETLKEWYGNSLFNRLTEKWTK